MAPQAWLETPSSSSTVRPSPASPTISTPGTPAAATNTADHSQRSLSDRTIAIVAVVSIVILVSLIVCAIYFYRRHRRSSIDLSSRDKVVPGIEGSLEVRKQTHADPKVHAWLSRLTSDYTGTDGFRQSMPKSIRTVVRPFSMLSDRWNWRDSVLRASDMEEQKGDENETRNLKRIRFEP